MCDVCICDKTLLFLKITYLSLHPTTDNVEGKKTRQLPQEHGRRLQERMIECHLRMDGVQGWQLIGPSEKENFQTMIILHHPGGLPRILLD